MAHINLLPWRAERRKQREREFYMMLVATAVGAFAVLFAAILWMNHLIDDQNGRNAYLQQEISALDKKIEEIKELDKTKASLLTRKEIIEQLQSNRSQMVHLFDELVKTIPDGTRLTSMKQSGDTLTLEGVAESNSRVATYMRNIDVSPWMGRSDLGKIENKSGTKEVDAKAPYVFSLDVKLRKPEDAESAEAAASENDSAEPVTGGAQPTADLGTQLENASKKLMDQRDSAKANTTSKSANRATGEKK